MALARAAGAAVRREPPLCDDRARRRRRRSRASPATIWSRSSSAGCGPTIWRSSSFPTCRWPKSSRCSSSASAPGRRRPSPRASRLSPPRRRARPAQRIVLIDRPGSPQSVILGGQITPVDPRGDIVPRSAAPTTCSAATSCRGSTWTCARPRAGPMACAAPSQLNVKAVPYIVSAPVQADRTGDSIVALQPAHPRLPRQARASPTRS